MGRPGYISRIYILFLIIERFLVFWKDISPLLKLKEQYVPISRSVVHGSATLLDRLTKVVQLQTPFYSMRFVHSRGLVPDLQYRGSAQIFNILCHFPHFTDRRGCPPTCVFEHS